MSDQNIDKEYIEARVTEWISRVNDLYDFVRRTISHSKTAHCSDAGSVQMYEELMQKFGVRPTDVPVLNIIKEEAPVATFKPIGLWVVGANGRIDILSDKGAYVVVDSAKYGTKPDWKVYSVLSATLQRAPTRLSAAS